MSLFFGHLHDKVFFFKELANPAIDLLAKPRVEGELLLKDHFQIAAWYDGYS